MLCKLDLLPTVAKIVRLFKGPAMHEQPRRELVNRADRKGLYKKYELFLL